MMKKRGRNPERRENMGEVLIYNLSPQQDAKLKMLCRKLNIGSRSVEKSEYGHRLGYLLGLTGDDTVADGEDFDDAMLYIAGLGGMLDLFLNLLRRNKIIIPLKAVQTEHNTGFTSYELYRELSAERAAIARGLNAHQPS